MKKILFIIIAILFTVSSCQDMEEMNVDPNRATTTHPRLLLTQIEWNTFRDYGGTSPLYAIKMLVQTDGENAQQYYKWDRSDFTGYSRLRDVTKMMEEASAINDNSYIALGKFFRAYHFFNMALTFGDIPYTEALMGETDKIYTPKYDTQKDVLKGILKELEEANDLLKGQQNIIAGDIIYNGNSQQWVRLINSFRLKILLTLSKRVDNSDMSIQSSFSSIAANEDLMQSTADNGQLVFLDQEGNRYPQFNSSSFGSGMYMDSTFIKRLQDREDPRLFLYCTQTKEAKEAGKAIDDFSAYEGGDPAAPYNTVNEKATRGKVSKVNERYYQDPTNEPLILLSYSELQLILAEASVRGWIQNDAKSYYENGIKASFKFYETYAKNLGNYVSETKATSYLANPNIDFAAATTTEKKLDLIITQRYLQSFFQHGWTSFFDHLRTGYPTFRRPSGTSIPYRWIYPQSEYNNNSTNVSAAIETQFGTGNDKINQPTWWIK